MKIYKVIHDTPGRNFFQICLEMEDRARKATEDYGAMEGFDSFAECLAYYLRQAENDLILP